MKKPISETEALKRIQHVCSKHEKCSQDIKDKLRQWGYQGDFESIVSQLTAEKYVDDARYAEAFVRDKVRFSAWGKNKIRYQLKVKQIASEHIDKALTSIPDDDYRSIVKKELHKKWKSINTQDQLKGKQKLLAFAVQRGYEAELVYPLVDALLNGDF